MWLIHCATAANQLAIIMFQINLTVNIASIFLAISAIERAALIQQNSVIARAGSIVNVFAFSVVTVSLFSRSVGVSR